MILTTIFKRILLASLCVLLLGAGPGSNPPPPPSIPNTEPDIEEATNSSLDEEAGLELPPDQSVQPGADSIDPTQGQVDQAHGFYAHGALANFSKFDLEGEGFMKLFVPRDRGYATYDLTQVVMMAAAQLHHDYPGGERIQIGDVCAKNGGKLALHASHQNGLDADIVYPRLNHHEQDPQSIAGYDETFVQNGKISPNFDEERVWAFIKTVYSTGRLVRIFMDPVIKATLCEYSQKIGEYNSQAELLRRIRPLPLHKNHMHVRISCPQKSLSCIRQSDPTVGTGCADILPTPVKQLF